MNFTFYSNKVQQNNLLGCVREKLIKIPNINARDQNHKLLF